MPRRFSQAELFGGPSAMDIVNVAKVAKLSPFRYPGGKTWFVPRVRQWLLSKPAFPAQFVEPFVGGGIISLTVAAESLASLAVMVELDNEVASVWETIFGGDSEWLARKILEFELTPENLERQLMRKTSSQKEIAFKTILKNRTFHGGILAPGSAPLRHGENGKGIKSRWYPETLANRIREAAQLSDHIQFLHTEAFSVINQRAEDPDTVFFVDPPYTAGGKKAGARLYKHWELDHSHLFDLMARVAGDFIMTYDVAPEIQALAREHGFDFEKIAMKNTHHSEMTELVIGKDLDWLRAN